MRSVTLVAVLLLVSRNAAADPVAAERSVSPTTDASPSPSADNRESARRLFAMGADLVRSGRYAAAKALFLEAYAVEPNSVVLYNVAQAELLLGEPELAVRHLQQILQEGGDAIEPALRKAVESELARVESTHPVEARTEPEQPLGATTNDVSPSSDVFESAPRRFTASATEAAFSMPVTSVPPVHERSSKELALPAWTYAVIVGGFALTGTAVGLYVWNDNRHREWSREDQDLRALKADLLRRGTLPADDNALVARAAANDQRLESIQSLDAVPFALGGMGVAAMGVGLWALMAVRDTGTWSLSLSASEIHARARF